MKGASLMIAAALVAVAGSASAGMVEDAQARFERLNDECRDSPNAQKACDARDVTEKWLKKNNLCYNSRSRSPAEAWMPCEVDTNGPRPQIFPACVGIADSRNLAACQAWQYREGQARAWQRWAN